LGDHGQGELRSILKDQAGFGYSMQFVTDPRDPLHEIQRHRFAEPYDPKEPHKSDETQDPGSVSNGGQLRR
jgi:hypothetical protein